MSLKEVKKAVTESDAFFIAKQVFLFVAAVVSMSLAITALVQLQTVASDVSDVLKNWETKPVVEIQTVNYDEPCPEGFDDDSEDFYKLALQSFPGVSKGHCVCSAEAAFAQVYSTYASCAESTAQEDAGCKTVPSIAGSDFRRWRGAKICYRRGGESQVTFDPSYERRPRPELEEGVYTCPKGYQVCGSGSYDENYAICFPDDELCPFTGLILSDAAPSGDGYEEIMGTNFTGGFKLYGRRGHPSELAVVDLKVALTKVDTGYDRDDLEDYSGSDNSRGPCYEGPNQRYTSSFKYDTEYGIVDDLTPRYPTQCNKVDRRYRLLDFIPQEDLMVDNFQLHASCQNSDLKSLTDPLYVATDDPDYHKSEVSCNPSSSTVDQQCFFEPGFTCAAADTICLQTTAQTKCGAVVHAAREVTAEQTTWGWYGRGEIYWADECVPQIKPLERSREPLQATVAAQTAAVVFSCIANVILGIIFPITAYHSRFPSKKKCSFWKCCCAICFSFACCCTMGTGTDEKRVEKCRRRWDVLLKMTKVITLAVVLAHLDRIRDFYALLGDKNCSDGLTNHTFDYLGTELPKIFATSIANIVLDGLMLAGGLVLAIRARMKKDKVETGPHEIQMESQETPSSPSSPPSEGSAPSAQPYVVQGHMVPPTYNAQSDGYTPAVVAQPLHMSKGAAVAPAPAPAGVPPKTDGLLRLV